MRTYRDIVQQALEELGVVEPGYVPGRQEEDSSLSKLRSVMDALVLRGAIVPGFERARHTVANGMQHEYVFGRSTFAQASVLIPSTDDPAVGLRVTAKNAVAGGYDLRGDDGNGWEVAVRRSFPGADEVSQADSEATLASDDYTGAWRITCPHAEANGITIRVHYDSTLATFYSWAWSSIDENLLQINTHPFLGHDYAVGAARDILSSTEDSPFPEDSPLHGAAWQVTVVTLFLSVDGAYIQGTMSGGQNAADAIPAEQPSLTREGRKHTLVVSSTQPIFNVALLFAADEYLEVKSTSDAGMLVGADDDPAVEVPYFLGGGVSPDFYADPIPVRLRDVSYKPVGGLNFCPLDEINLDTYQMDRRSLSAGPRYPRVFYYELAADRGFLRFNTALYPGDEFEVVWPKALPPGPLTAEAEAPVPPGWHRYLSLLLASELLNTYRLDQLVRRNVQMKLAQAESDIRKTNRTAPRLTTEPMFLCPPMGRGRWRA